MFRDMHAPTPLFEQARPHLLHEQTMHGIPRIRLGDMEAPINESLFTVIGAYAE